MQRLKIFFVPILNYTFLSIECSYRGSQRGIWARVLGSNGWIHWQRSSHYLETNWWNPRQIRENVQLQQQRLRQPRVPTDWRGNKSQQPSIQVLGIRAIFDFVSACQQTDVPKQGKFQSCVCLKTIKKFWHFQNYLLIRVFMHIFLGVVIGGLFYQMGNDATKTIFNFGFCFTIIIVRFTIFHFFW